MLSGLNISQRRDGNVVAERQTTTGILLEGRVDFTSLPRPTTPPLVLFLVLGGQECGCPAPGLGLFGHLGGLGVQLVETFATLDGGEAGTSYFRGRAARLARETRHPRL